MKKLFVFALLSAFHLAHGGHTITLGKVVHVFTPPSYTELIKKIAQEAPQLAAMLANDRTIQKLQTVTSALHTILPEELYQQLEEKIKAHQNGGTREAFIQALNDSEVKIALTDLVWRLAQKDLLRRSIELLKKDDSTPNWVIQEYLKELANTWPPWTTEFDEAHAFGLIYMSALSTKSKAEQNSINQEILKYCEQLLKLWPKNEILLTFKKSIQEELKNPNHQS